MQERMPRHDDEPPLGVQFFRTLLEGADLSGLTLPRTFFGHSEVRKTSFARSDLTESNLCWNDFASVDFSNALLLRSDMRASRFERVNFTGADLRDADLRQSSFERCVFDNALMAGTLLASSQRGSLGLSTKQQAEVSWKEDGGSEPGGG